MRLLREIQSKPSDAKARYAAVGASVVTGLIALIWVTTLPSRFASVTPAEGEVSDTRGTEEFKELFDETKAQLGNVINWQEAIEELSGETTNLDTLNTPDYKNGEAESTAGEVPKVADDETSPDEIETPPEEESEGETPRTVLIGTTTPAETE
jgi:hypothetical protein